MKPVEAIPPPLPRPATTRPARQVLQSLALLLGLMVFARVALHFQLPLPGCPLREMTGMPCPFCGSTRAFAALARLELGEALRLNPLVSLIACVAGGWWMLSILRRRDPRAWLKHSFMAGTAWKWLLAVALALNWLYLWFHLPR